MENPYAILFEPVQIGPVTAPNRFFQVPHCNGMGYRMPEALAEMRRVKAEGGWGVVCTEEVEIHPSTDLMPYIEGRLWADADMPALALMADAVHLHGALAGIELAYNDLSPNFYSREAGRGPGSRGVLGINPGQSSRMDKEDIRDFRRWHRTAAIRSKEAGFDLIYVYAGHNLSVLMHFLQRRYNDRSDEYGGSLENRVRLLREVLEDTKEAVGDRCAVALRLAVDELLGEDGITHDGEGREIVSLLADLPDLWDVNISAWPNDSATSRFEKEGYQEPYIAFVKSLTGKPVVGVGRYTSPESMVSAVKRGIVDLIGAARPSIADPFLPEKIRQGRVEDIRECIGCNICVSTDMLSTPIRCTQNPTMGEEWRRGWHPERVQPKQADAEIMIIGAGPAGLECARVLGERGYHVTLLEGRKQIGGRVDRESRLPGLREWRRVLDWRATQIEKLPNVSVYPGSPMTPADVLESGVRHVIIATGSTWRRDGIGRALWKPVPGHDLPTVYTPDDLMSGTLPAGRVLIYDDDHYYMGGALAELLIQQGCMVTLATPAALASAWTAYTLEQEKIEKKLVEMGVTILTRRTLKAIRPGGATLSDSISGSESDLPCDAVVLVTDRLPEDGLYRALKPALAEGRLDSLRVIGDAEAPNLIVRAVFSGYRAAAEFGEVVGDEVSFRVERVGK